MDRVELKQPHARRKFTMVAEIKQGEIMITLTPPFTT